MRKKILFACLGLGIGLYLILTRQPHRKEEMDVISAISMQNAASHEEHIARVTALIRAATEAMLIARMERKRKQRNLKLKIR